MSKSGYFDWFERQSTLYIIFSFYTENCERGLFYKQEANKTSNADNTTHDDDEGLPGGSEDDLNYFNSDLERNHDGGDYRSDDDESGEAIVSSDLIEESWIKVTETN